MTALFLFLAYSTVIACAFFLLGALMSHCGKHDEVDGPDGTAGDLLADQPAEVLVDDEQVRQLERTWLL